MPVKPDPPPVPPPPRMEEKHDAVWNLARFALCVLGVFILGWGWGARHSSRINLVVVPPCEGFAEDSTEEEVLRVH